jgi:hypothetical protein
MGIEDVAGERIEHSLAENGAETSHRHEFDIPTRQHAKEFGGVAVSVEVFAVTTTLNEFALKTIAGGNLLSAALPINHNHSHGNASRANGIEDCSAS